MANGDVSYEDLMGDEWSPMTTGKAFKLRAALRDWSENRQAGGYDVRLIEGAIAVCDEYVRRPGNMEGIPTERRPTQEVDHEIERVASKRVLTIETGRDHPSEIDFGEDANEIYVWYMTGIGPIEEQYLWDVELDAWQLVSRKMLTGQEWERREAEQKERDAKHATTGCRAGRGFSWPRRGARP